MMNRIHIFRLFAGFIFAAVLLFQVYDTINSCGGNYIYPLDDTYIHLSIANNLSTHGIWGITAYEFSSSSSSLLYTLILALFIKIFGNYSLLPLIINFLISYLIIIYVFNILVRYFKNVLPNGKDLPTSSGMGLLLFFATTFITFSAPIVILTLSGMEHILQIFIDIIFIDYFIKYIGSNSRKEFNVVLVLSALVTGIRFEGIFLVLIIIVILLFKKQYSKSLLILFSAALPIIIFGIISTANGWMFLPNSILIKSSKPETYDFVGILLYPLKWLFKLSNEHHLLTIFVASASLLYVNYKKRKQIFELNNLWHIITISLIIIHLTFARTGWVYRYEAYIVVIGLLGVIINAFDILKFGERNLKNAVIALCIIMALACSMRTYKSLDESVTMSVNIYEQQYQMSRFLKEFYNESNVVLGDIGACTYFTNIKLLDLVALGSIEPLKQRIEKKFNSNEIEKLADEKDMQIAILYKDAFEDYIPENWLEVGSWKISNNIGCFKDKVTFYAVNPEKYIELSDNMIQFKKKLPPSVEVNIIMEQIIDK